MSRPLAVAITGGIGAGKSEALAAFARHGAEVISSDEIVHRLLATDDAVRDAIRERLGGSAYASLGMPFPSKPKRMRWATYRRLREVSERCRHGSLLAAARRFGLLPDELDDMGMD